MRLLRVTLAALAAAIALNVAQALSAPAGSVRVAEAAGAYRPLPDDNPPTGG